MSKVGERIDQASRAELERMAGAMLREMAKASLRRQRNIATAMREHSQIVHLAIRLEAFAGADLTPSVTAATVAGPTRD